MSRILEKELRLNYPFEVKHSSKLMGINGENGTRLYRHSVLLRLIPLKKGDIISLGGIKFTVFNLTKKKIKLQRYGSVKIQQENFSILQKKKWFFLSSDDEI